ncbi:adenine phosphoribosyltransferase [Acuticoccus mangrovi]|uniref:Adenine phosphoribosyltransferase n=1 Tax=Acuticoccus mangrovi TaxID=2796142 RepID=A0A934MIP4_9HYPH|nr:adenine phosphoribosyltransferase [Acuticoccus mangrovi]MBJ3777401.1 adenine phosphoribosyltransferase [Acuticoccus mangrovi]
MDASTIDIEKLVRVIPDYPKTGIIFRDVTTLFADADGLRVTIEAMAAPFRDAGIDLIVGVDARGFIIGGAMGMAMGKGFVPIRKRGKLPPEVYREEYTLEYGTSEVEINVNAVPKGARVLLVDDLIATGGTAMAAVKLVERVGGTVAAASFTIDLPDIGGSKLLRAQGVEVFSVLSYPGD